jgi:hypothetical protein
MFTVSHVARYKARFALLCRARLDGADYLPIDPLFVPSLGCIHVWYFTYLAAR